MDLSKSFAARVVAPVVVAGGLAANTANAGLINQFDFEGDNVEGTLLFDTIGADTNGSDQIGSYALSFLDGSSVTVDSDTIDLTDGTLNVLNDVFLTDNLFGVFNVASGSEISGNPVTFVNFEFQGLNALAGEDLISALNANYTGTKDITFNFDGNSFTRDITEYGYSARQMPTGNVSAPGTAGAVILGLGLLGWQHRRTQKKAQNVVVNTQGNAQPNALEL